MNEHEKEVRIDHPRTYEAQIQSILDLVAMSPFAKEGRRAR